MDAREFSQLAVIPARMILAPVTPMHGNEIKPRPLVLLTRPAIFEPNAEFKVAAGSKRAPKIHDLSYTIKVPGRSGKHPRTRLTYDTWFYAGWIRKIKVSDVLDFFGFFPSYEYEKFTSMIEQYLKDHPA